MRKCRVGVFFALSSQSHRSVAYALSRVMRGHAEFAVTHVNVDLSLEGVRARLLESIYSSEPFDVYVTLGLRCSVYAQRVMSELGISRPLIFAGVRSPEFFGLVKSYESPGVNVTAVICEPTSSLAMASKVAVLKKYINKVIIPYCPFKPGDYVTQQVTDLIQYFESERIAIDPISVDSHAGLLPLIEERVQPHDAVFLLEAAAGNVHEKAAYLCWERDALLCTYGLEAIESGALCTLGIDLYEIAQGVSYALLAFWIDKIPLGSIPVLCLPSKRVFVINKAMTRAIGIPDEALEPFHDQPGVMVVKKWINCPTERASL